MINTSNEEFIEASAQKLPDPSLETLQRLRNELCFSASFKLQPSQLFLKRAMSPDSPARNLLMVHGTGQGKTCTSIQIAEEYISKPEYQDKRVLILANPSIQQNFKDQIFDVSRVYVDENDSVVSKQCTGRKYLDILQRLSKEPLRFSNKVSRNRILFTASKLIDSFYEFQGYETFANIVESQENELKSEFESWVHATFDNRLIIVDEAHHLIEKTDIVNKPKQVALALERILKIANGITLVMLTATPMYDTVDEIVYYFNLFLWNDRKIGLGEKISVSSIFNISKQGVLIGFQEGKEQQFRTWCQQYISFVRGENPFTFPYRLNPPSELVAERDRETDINGETIKTPLQYLTLTKSYLSDYQANLVKNAKSKAIIDPVMICTYPENSSFRETFTDSADGFQYRGEQFLSPSRIETYSSKFKLIVNCIAESTGIVFVFSNLVESGAQLFAMCLEEHGYGNYTGENLLATTSEEIPRNSRGKYILLTSSKGMTDLDIKKLLVQVKMPENKDGQIIKVIVSSPKIAEGIDFRYIRQVHILDPWFNMSRIEQVIGRAMRTCSHVLLPFEHQNCTVYLHACRYRDTKQETLDEFVYRTFVERKGIAISKVKRVIMESAMDCDLQYDINNLPASWTRDLKIPQIRDQDKQHLELSISEMTAPTFLENDTPITCNLQPVEKDANHTRPLSSIVDVKYDIENTIRDMFNQKLIWSKDDFYNYQDLRVYSRDVVDYNVQQIIDSKMEIVASDGRKGYLESRRNMFVLTFQPKTTLLQRILPKSINRGLLLKPKEEKNLLEIPIGDIQKKLDSYKWSETVTTHFSRDVLNWYLIDSYLNTDERIQYVLNSEQLPMHLYANIAKGEAQTLYIFDNDTIYNREKQRITPVGSDKDLFVKWLDNRINHFVANKDKIFASSKAGRLIFNADQTSSDLIKRAERIKNIGGRACTSYEMGLLLTMIGWLGSEFPEITVKKVDRCIWLDLTIRKAVLAEHPGIFWVTPEEYLVFTNEKNKSRITAKI